MFNENNDNLGKVEQVYVTQDLPKVNEALENGW